MAIENEQYVKNSLNKYLYTTKLYNDFSGGINSINPQTDIQINELNECVNLVLNRDKSIKPRGGVSKHSNTQVPNNNNYSISGMFYAQFKNANVFVVCVGEKIYGTLDFLNYIELTSSLTRIYSPTISYSFSFLNDTLIISDGINKPLKVTYNGSFITSPINNAPICKYVITLYSYVFFAGDNTNKIYFSSINNIDDYPVENCISIGGSIDNSQIVGLSSMAGNIVIFKRNSVYYMTGNSSTSFSVSQISNSIGSLYDNCNVVAENEIYFIGNNGLYKINYNYVLENISSKFYNTIQMISNQLTPIMFYDYNLKHIWINCLDINNKKITFIYDLQLNCLLKYIFFNNTIDDTTPYFMLNFNLNDSNIIIGCNKSNRYIRRYNTSDNTDDGNLNYCYFETKYFNFGDYNKFKSLISVTVNGSNGSYGNYGETSIYSSDLIYEFDSKNNKIRLNKSFNMLINVEYPAVIEKNGYLYIIGGLLNGTPTDYVQKIDISDNNYKYFKTNMPKKLANFSCVCYNNFIYIFGGIDSNGNLNNIVYKYDIQNDSWINVNSNMPTPRIGCIWFIYGTKIYLIGGISNSGHSNIVERYDFLTNTWESFGTIPFTIAYSGYTDYSNYGYSFGGYINGSISNNIYKFSINTSVTTELLTVKLPQSQAFCSCRYIGNSKYILLGGNNNSGYINSIYLLTFDNVMTNLISLEEKNSLYYNSSYIGVSTTSYDGNYLDNYFYICGGKTNYNLFICKFCMTNDIKNISYEDTKIYINNTTRLNNLISNKLYKFASLRFIFSLKQDIFINNFYLDYFMWERRV